MKYKEASEPTHPRIGTLTTNNGEVSRQLASEYIISLFPDLFWKLGEASGSPLDYSGNDRTATLVLGGGQRAVAALDSGGDGALLFATDTDVYIEDTTGIDNMWANGGCFAFLMNVDELQSDVLWSKRDAGLTTGWQIQSTADGYFLFTVKFTGLEGTSKSARFDTPSGTLTAGETNAVAIIYDGNDALNATIIVWNPSNGLKTLTLDDGLHRTFSPKGVPSDDSECTFGLNYLFSTEGTYDEIVIWAGNPPTVEEIHEWIDLVQG